MLNNFEYIRTSELNSLSLMWLPLSVVLSQLGEFVVNHNILQRLHKITSLNTT